MARYIDADKLEKDFPQSGSKHNVIINGNEYPVFLVDHVLHKIRNYPTADVVEVKHGKWQFVNQATNYLEPPTGDMCKCSVCEYEIDVSEAHFKYCPNCGAKMDGKDNNVPVK